MTKIPVTELAGRGLIGTLPGQIHPDKIPGWEGSVGPGPGQYTKLHVYARSTESGAGNCVCGSALGDWIHIQAAPGIPIPDSMRPKQQFRASPEEAPQRRRSNPT